MTGPVPLLPACPEDAGSATMTGGVPTSIAAEWRVPAELLVRAGLARALLRPRPRRGPGRLRAKAVRALFHLVHQRLRVPAAATLHLADGTEIAVDCANTAYLHYAVRNRSAQGFEPEVGGLLIGLAERLRVVYDIGANWGYYPLLLGAEPRFRGTVHAFEIGPRTAADLHRLVGQAGLARRVAVHEFGLSDREGEVRLSRERHSYLARIVGEDYKGAVDRVRVRRLDDLQLPPPDLIKLDVEGHEAAVLAGAAGTLARHRPLVVMESWHRPEQPEAMLGPLRWLAGLGYRFHRLEWRPVENHVGASGAATTLRRGAVALVPFAAADRPGIRATLNVLAAPADRGLPRWEEG